MTNNISIEEVHILENKDSSEYREHNDKILSVINELRAKLLEGKELSIYFSVIENNQITSGSISNANLLNSLRCSKDIHELLLKVLKVQLEEFNKIFGRENDKA